MEGRVDLPGRPGAWVREVRPQGGQGPGWGRWALREATSRVPSTVSHFRMEPGTSLEML